MVYKRSLLVFCLIICVLFGVSFVSASDANDTVMASGDTNQVIEGTNVEQAITSADDVNDKEIRESSDDEDVLSDGAGTFTDLQKIIDDAQSGSTITLQKGYTYDENFTTDGILIDKELTINGNGHNINGLSKANIFKFSSSSYGFSASISNIKFINGKTAISALNKVNVLNIEDCVFNNNKNSAILIHDGILNIENSVFTNNQVSGDGGAISAYESSSPFSYDDVEMHIKNCQFKNNKATKKGGAIYTYYSTPYIENCIFTNNNAYDGGAIYNEGFISVKGSVFRDNRANNDGGAIRAKPDLDKMYSSGTVILYNLIQDSKFVKNNAKYGGAIYSYGHQEDVDVKHCTFEDNKANLYRDVANVNTINCIFNYLKLTLNTVNVKKSSGSFFLTATLKKGSTPIKGKIVSFKFNGKTYKVKTNSKGIAKVTINKAVINKLVVGKTISYQAYSCKLTVKKTAKVKK